jgi:hypothetical protein
MLVPNLAPARSVREAIQEVKMVQVCSFHMAFPASLQPEHNLLRHTIICTLTSANFSDNPHKLVKNVSRVRNFSGIYYSSSYSSHIFLTFAIHHPVYSEQRKFNVSPVFRVKGSVKLRDFKLSLFPLAVNLCALMSRKRLFRCCVHAIIY